MVSRVSNLRAMAARKKAAQQESLEAPPAAAPRLKNLRAMAAQRKAAEQQATQ
jgi:hypothetical protein